MVFVSPHELGARRPPPQQERVEGAVLFEYTKITQPDGRIEEFVAGIANPREEPLSIGGGLWEAIAADPEGSR